MTRVEKVMAETSVMACFRTPEFLGELDAHELDNVLIRNGFNLKLLSCPKPPRALNASGACTLAPSLEGRLASGNLRNAQWGTEHGAMRDR